MRIRWFLDEAADGGYRQEDVAAPAFTLPARAAYARWSRVAGSRYLMAVHPNRTYAHVAARTASFDAYRASQRTRYPLRPTSGPVEACSSGAAASAQVVQAQG